MLQSQITNCRRTASFSDFDNIALGRYVNRPAAVQFQRWQFIFETPSVAFSWFRKKLDGDQTIFEPSKSLLTHLPGSVRSLSGDQTMPSEIRRYHDDFYESVYLKIVRLPDCLRPTTGLPPPRRLTELRRAPPDYKSSSDHRPMNFRSLGDNDFVNSFRSATGRQTFTLAT